MQGILRSMPYALHLALYAIRLALYALWHRACSALLQPLQQGTETSVAVPALHSNFRSVSVATETLQGIKTLFSARGAGRAERLAARDQGTGLAARHAHSMHAHQARDAVNMHAHQAAHAVARSGSSHHALLASWCVLTRANACAGADDQMDMQQEVLASFEHEVSSWPAAPTLCSTHTLHHPHSASHTLASAPARAPAYPDADAHTV